MNCRTFGRTRFRISELTFGAMTIHKRGFEGGVSQSLLKPLDAGINCIDTARACGTSEATIARTLKEWKGQKPFIFTKVAPLPTATWRFYRPLEEAFTPQSIVENVIGGRLISKLWNRRSKLSKSRRTWYSLVVTYEHVAVRTPADSPNLHRENHGFDVCVVGGGMAGIYAAIASARNGANTGLIHGRPVSGGNFLRIMDFRGTMERSSV